jgi:hypothetical protein
MIPDFRNVTGFDDIYSRFLIAARSIMLEHDLVFDQRAERLLHITSLELYLRCSQWLDPNTDKNSEQGNSKTWYIRRQGSNANSQKLTLLLDVELKTFTADFSSGELMETMVREGRLKVSCVEARKCHVVAGLRRRLKFSIKFTEAKQLTAHCGSSVAKTRWPERSTANHASGSVILGIHGTRSLGSWSSKPSSGD